MMSDTEEQTLTGEHQHPQQRQAIFNSYYRLSEWVAWAQPLAMNMRKGTMPGLTGEVMVVDYISGRE
jgi:hypothetical protein